MSRGSSDVYSYPEDDSVLDPILGQHLAFFGIDFSSLQKVRYSLTECLRNLFNFAGGLYVEIDIFSLG